MEAEAEARLGARAVFAGLANSLYGGKRESARRGFLVLMTRRRRVWPGLLGVDGALGRIGRVIRWGWRYLAVLGVLLFGAVGAVAEVGGPEVRWTQPAQITHGHGPFGALYGMSCPTVSLCVAGDLDGNVYASRKPTRGARAWHPAHLADDFITAVSCPSVRLCVAVGSSGEIFSTRRPTSGASAWRVVYADGERFVDSLSCASASWCVAADTYGAVLTSQHPTGSAEAWTRVRVRGLKPPGFNSVSCPTDRLCVATTPFQGIAVGHRHGNVITWWFERISRAGAVSAVSCPNPRFCVVVDNTGDVLTSTNPGALTPRWRLTNVDHHNVFLAVACTSRAWCVAVDAAGNAVSSREPLGGAGDWVVQHIDRRGPISEDLHAVSCGAPERCVAGDLGGAVLASTTRDGGARTPPSSR